MPVLAGTSVSKNSDLYFYEFTEVKIKGNTHFVNAFLHAPEHTIEPRSTGLEVAGIPSPNYPAPFKYFCSNVAVQMLPVKFSYSSFTTQT